MSNHANIDIVGQRLTTAFGGRRTETMPTMPA
jgi:hypothetical protein